MTIDRSLRDKVVVVTGASRGIGQTIAQRFAALGAAVAVSARTVNEGDHRFAGSISSTVAAIRESGGEAIAIAGDFSHSEDRERLIATTNEQLGPIDILINNAAITFFTPVHDFPLNRWQLMFDVQVLAPFHLSQLVVDQMAQRGAGWILNISSPAARHPEGPPYGPTGGTVYGMCKAALERFSTGLAAELYAKNIAVNALSPTGLVVTPGVRHHELEKRIPADRHEPASVMAEAALVLCTGDPHALTGRVTYSQELLNEFGIDWRTLPADETI